MKLFILGAVAACHLTGLAPEAECQPADQKMHLTSGAVRLEANRIEREASYPSVIHLNENVEILTKVVVRQLPLSLMIMVVNADEADYHEDTGEIEARGKVRVEYRDDPSQGKPAGNLRIKLESLKQ